MAVYTYKATSPAEPEQVGTIAADTPRQARDLLRDRGLSVRDLTVFTPGLASSRSFFLRRSSHRRLTTSLIRDLATLLGVGMPLLEAIETAAAQANGAIHSAIVLLRDQVAAGASLAAAMADQPRVFDYVAISIAAVGEDAGTLDTSLERLAEFRERSDAVANRIATAMIYPLIVTVVGAFSSVFLMTFVVPKILQPLIEQDLPLPWPTRIVKGVSDGVIGWWWLILIVAAMLVGGFSIIWNSQTGRRKWDQLMLELPLIGDLIAKQSLTRIAEVLSTLLKSGIEFVPALEIARRTISNRVMQDALRRCEVAILAGGHISTAMEQTGVFPAMAVQVFALGQQSGRMEEMLDRLAKAYDTQTSTTAARVVAILEPGVIVLLAGVVLFVVLATVLPILEVGDAIR